MARVEQVIGAVRRRMALAVLLREGLLGAAVALCLAGSAALLLRRFAGWEADRAVWSGLVLLLVPPVGWWRTRGRLPERQDAATWLDLRGGGRGWLVTAIERPDPAWSAAAEAEIPDVRPPLPMRRPLGALAVALSFCLGALWVPLARPGSPVTPVPTEALSSKKAAVEALVQLPEDQDLALEAALDRLAAADGRSESALEAAEALSAELDAAAAAADQAGRDARGALEAAGSDAAAGLAGAAAALGLDAASDAAKGPVPRLPEGLAEALRQAAAQQAQGGALEAQAARDLASTLSQTLDELHTQLVEGQLVQAGAGQEGEAQPGQEGEGEARPGQEGEGEAGEGVGQGGVSRGPGVAPLTFGDPSSEDGTAWREHTLPSARYADLEHSELVGSGLAAPTADPQGQGASGALDGDAAGGQRPLSPSQRRAVSGFFGAQR